MRSRFTSRLSLLILSFAIAMIVFPAVAFAETVAPDGTTGASLPTIQSDQADYPPGATVTLTGSNWQPGEHVHLYVNDDSGKTWDYNADVNADANGDVSHTFNLPDWFVATYKVTATGDASGVATHTFTDAIQTTTALTRTGPNPSNLNQAVGFTATVTCGQTCTFDTSSSGDTMTLVEGASANCTGGTTLATVQASSFSGSGLSRTANFNYAFTSSGDKSIRACFNGGGPGTQAGSSVSQALTQNVNAGAAAQLAFTQQPTNAVVDAPITPAPAVEVQDSFGTPVTSSNASVTVALASGSPAGTLGGTKTVSAVGGVATFSDLSIDTVNSNYRLTATGSGLTSATSNAFNTTRRATNTTVSCSPSQLGFTQQTKCTATVTDTSAGTKSAPTGSVTWARSGNTGTFSGAPCTLQSVSGDTSKCSVNYTPNGTSTHTDTITATYQQSTKHLSDAGTTTVRAAALQATTLTADPASGTPGGTTTLKATLKSGSTNVVGRTISFELNGNSVGTATTDSSGVATLSNVSLNGFATGTYPINATFNGDTSGTITYNGSTGSNTLTVAPSNRAPTANNDTLTTNEDAAGTVNVLANDTDLDGDTLTVTSNTNPAHGTVSLSGGTFTYTPAPDYNGPDSFTYTVSDGKGGTATGTVNITVTAVDDSPVAVNDTKTVAEDDPATTINVLANDTDIDGGTKTVASVTQPTNGTVAITNGGNDLTYKPNGNYCNGGSPTDNFTYTLNGGSTATVAVTVTCVNDAPVANNDSATTNEDTAKDIAVLANDTDPEGNTLSVSSFTQPSNGTVTQNADGTLKYTPNADFNGSDSFTYKAKDASLDSNSATVSLTVTSVNDAPVAKADAKTTDEDTPLTFPASDLVSNDDKGAANENGQSLTVTEVSGATHGTVSLGADGNITFTPDANFNGAASFDYRVCDNGSPSQCSVQTATVNVTVNAVNDAPVAVNDSKTTNEDTATDINVVANDTDEEGDTLSVSSFTQPSNGTVTQNADGTLKYTPNNNYNGPDSFTYKANDGSLDSNVATVSITVNAVNDAPVADDQSVTTDEDTAKAVTLGASDVEGDALSYSIVSGPAHGTLSGTGATRTYIPAADYNGPDSFTFKANDGTDDSNVATVSITVNAVNDAPVAVDDTATTDEDTPVDIAANELLANDSTGPANESGQTLTIKSVSNGQHGQATLNNDGSVTFTPDADFFGEASFDYTVCDDGTPQKCYEGTATVKVTVNAVNDAPVAVNDTATTDEDTPKNINVIANDTDVDNTNAELSVSSFTQPAHGQVSQNADGTLKYTPAADYNGPDSFTYKAKDASLDSNSATVSITVTAVNDAPVAKDDSLTTNEDTAANGNVLTNDTDVDSANLTATQVSGPSHGTLTFNANGSYTYTPAANYNGPDSFTYKANDGSLDSNTATVSITVTAVNDAPVGTDDSYTTIEDTDLTVSAANGLLKNDTDIENDQLHVDDADASTPGINPVSGPSHGQLTLNADGSFTYKPNLDYNGADSFTYRVCDNGSPQKCSVETANVNIKIDPVNDAPVAVNDSKTTNEDTATDINVIANDTDVDNTNAELSVSSFTQPSNGTVTQNADGTLKYTPNNNYNGLDSFTYKAKDASLDSNSATVSITVTAVNDAPVAQGDSYNTNEDTQLQVAAPGVLTNDTDVDSANLTAVQVSGPSHGTLNLNANGSFSYTPAANYNGPDSFTYKASDGTASSNTVTVSITVGPVNDAPTVTLSGAATANEGDTNTYNFTVNDPDLGGTFTLKSGFPDCGTGGALVAGSLTTTASGGSFKCSFPDGPASPTVRIQVTDGQADSNIDTKSVAVANVNPTIGPLTVTGNSGTACIGSTNVVKLSFSITDPGVDTQSGTINWGDGTTTTFNGSSVTDAQHSYSAGTYNITVTASDSDGANATPKSTTAANQVSLLYKVSKFTDPVNLDGTSVFKSGSTIPLKVLITDCNNQPVSGLVPRISFTKIDPSTPALGVNEGLSTQPNDTNFLMRDAGNGQYIYNLSSKSLPDQDAKYNATITDSKATQTAPATYGPMTSQTFGIRTK
jgi:large repetitive protein